MNDMGVTLHDLSVADAVEIGAEIRSASVGAASMEEVANMIVRTLWEWMTPIDVEPSCVLVRCFVTNEGVRLPSSLARVADHDANSAPDSQHLVLLATEGIEAAWCDRRQSLTHRVIPLASEEMIATYPMVSRMFRQFGVPISALLDRSIGSFVDPKERAFGVFHVEDALDSPYVPDQEFIRDYEVKSVLAVGGPLPTGDIFAVLIFSRHQVSREVAALLQPLALSMKLAFLPVLNRVFANEQSPERARPSAEASLSVEASTLRSLLAVQEELLCGRYRMMESALSDNADSELTPRENQILRLVATGATNKQIASNLALTAGTVKWHLYNLFQKLAVETRTEAVIVAQQRGLVPASDS